MIHLGRDGQDNVTTWERARAATEVFSRTRTGATIGNHPRGSTKTEQDVPTAVPHQPLRRVSNESSTQLMSDEPAYETERLGGLAG